MASVDMAREKNIKLLTNTRKKNISTQEKLNLTQNKRRQEIF